MAHGFSSILQDFITPGADSLMGFYDSAFPEKIYSPICLDHKILTSQKIDLFLKLNQTHLSCGVSQILRGHLFWKNLHWLLSIQNLKSCGLIHNIQTLRKPFIDP